MIPKSIKPQRRIPRDKQTYWPQGAGCLASEAPGRREGWDNQTSIVIGPISVFFFYSPPASPCVSCCLAQEVKPQSVSLCSGCGDSAGGMCISFPVSSSNEVTLHWHSTQSCTLLESASESRRKAYVVHCVLGDDSR